MNDVVIAGAGPNGLMLANELGLAGVRPVVLEPLAGPNPQRRANGIIGQAVRLLDHRGLYGVLAGTPDPPQPSPWAMFAAMVLDLTRVPDSQHYMFPVQQPRLVQTLAERVRDNGADLRWGHRLVGFDQDTDRVVVHVDGPDGRYELRATYLVGADGGSSQTRKLAGVDFPGMTSHDAVARMAFGVLPPDEWVDPVTGALEIPGWGSVPPTPFHRAERGVFACRQFAGRSMLITLELDRSAQEDRIDDDEDETPVSLAEIEASVKRVLGADVPLRPASPDAPLDLRRFYGINSRIASRYRSDRVFLVGDAAHVHSPLGGPGLNLGLQDAVNLGWKLAAVVSGGADPALLDTYESERRPAAERVVMHSRAQLALVRPGTEVTALRDLFSELLEDSDNARRLSDLLSGNDNRYAVGADSHPLAGLWVPDFAIGYGGAARRVAELARTGRPLLIDLTEDAVVADATSDVAERITVAVGRPVDEVSATALLVRPDGYVAWASSAPKPEVDELRLVLREWFGIDAG
ncbi:MAG TPA: FAD-dependent monooxygenase [Mycobacterium sp.]|jgi:2-polyprenyl-6-methoxyphenol hydroxylase-like FAD-dependent oxidoreductase|uniref:FAD-dependent monooxygenase n=1 Tax=Mycobacterium sp. TaxID=1785 RepID=UPI002F3F5877